MIRQLDQTIVTVIAFAALIVVSNNPLAISSVKQTVFESMCCRRHIFGRFPNNGFYKKAVFKSRSVADQLFCSHMAQNAINRLWRQMP